MTETDTEVSNRLRFSGGLDALGSDLGTRVACEGDQGRRHGPPDGINVDARHELTIKLDEVRSQLQDVGEARVTGARVVDRDSKPTCAQGHEDRGNLAIAGYRLALGQLDDDSPRLENAGDGEIARPYEGRSPGAAQRGATGAPRPRRSALA